MSRTRRISAWALSLLLCFCGKANFVSAAPGDGHWDRQFGMPGTSTYNYALCVHKGRIYTAGFNYFYGAIAANTSIHVFNGTNWTQLGEFSGEPAVIYDIVFVGAEMYV
ncbi:MAG: hypothetical protein NZ739_06460, partial [Verrucomicrobiae bacterium]|nr:hypothetical protein [Verrucomicrobiae bacterium]MDW7979850.1 hypothetical protein [Verrucomicrobiales bacterium]